MYTSYTSLFTTDQLYGETQELIMTECVCIFQRRQIVYAISEKIAIVIFLNKSVNSPKA